MYFIYRFIRDKILKVDELEEAECDYTDKIFGAGTYAYKDADLFATITRYQLLYLLSKIDRKEAPYSPGYAEYISILDARMAKFME
jgi:hypothetical protein